MKAYKICWILILPESQHYNEDFIIACCKYSAIIKIESVWSQVKMRVLSIEEI